MRDAEVAVANKRETVSPAAVELSPPEAQAPMRPRKQPNVLVDSAPLVVEEESRHDMDLALLHLTFASSAQLGPDDATKDSCRLDPWQVVCGPDR
jgi:hypothetical protein